MQSSPNKSKMSSCGVCTLHVVPRHLAMHMHMVDAQAKPLHCAKDYTYSYTMGTEAMIASLGHPDGLHGLGGH